MTKKGKEEVQEEVAKSSQSEGKKDVKPDDRPEKNWQAEIDRKIEKATAEKDDVIKRLESQIGEIKQNQTAGQLQAEKAKLEEKFTDLGFDKEVADILEKQMESRIQSVRQEMENKFRGETSELKKQVNASSRDRYLSEIKKSDKTGLVDKHFQDIKGVINELDPGLWSSREGMENAVNMVLGNILRQNPTSVKAKDEPPTQDTPTPSPARKTSSAKKSTIQKIQEQYGVDEEKATEVAKASDDLDGVFYNQE